MCKGGAGAWKVYFGWNGRTSSSTTLVVFTVIGVLLIIHNVTLNLSLYYKMTSTTVISNASHSSNFLTSVKMSELSVEVPKTLRRQALYFIAI